MRPKLSELIAVRLTQIERAGLERLADRHGWTLSEAIRDAILARLESSEPWAADMREWQRRRAARLLQRTRRDQARVALK